MMNNTDNLIADGAEAIYTTGEGGGKGGGGGGFVEAENTLRSSSVVRIVEVLSEGPIEGVCGGARGIFLNDTPFANADGSPNFGGSAAPEFRVGGVDNAEHMPGFSSVQSESVVNAGVTIISNNIVRTVSSPLIDAVLVTMLLPNGLSAQETSSGNLNGSEVTFRIDSRVALGTYATVGTYTISGKTLNAYEAQYRIPRPAAATPGTYWDIRVTRITADPTAPIKNATIWARMTEIQDVKVTYPDTALVGLTVDASLFTGSDIPKRGYLVAGRLVKVPHNLNPATRIYTGAFNGSLVNYSKAFDNPVWCMYDFMTNTRYGASILPSDIDIFSFYDASIYCDASVSYTNRVGATISLPRFTFNVRIADRPEVFNLLKSIAGSMNANLIFWNGKWTLIQDRPTAATKLVTKANTLGGGFKYKSTGLFERHTAFNVTFNDRSDRHLARVVTQEDAAGIARYGYNTMDIAAYGCTTEGQAIRVAKWALDTEMNQTELIEFDMSLNGFDLMPGDVVSVYDEDTTQTRGAGKIVSVVGTTVVLDRAVNLSVGSKIAIVLADGRTTEERNIVQTVGVLDTITMTAGLTTAAFEQADFIVTSAISPKPFKIINVTCPEIGVVSIQGLFYDANKFARVEGGVTLAPLVFSNTFNTVVLPPTNLVFVLESNVLPNGQPDRQLRVSWTVPVQATVDGYDVVWSRSKDNNQAFSVDVNTCSIPANEDGLYKVNIFTRNFAGQRSGLPLAGTYLIDTNSVVTLLTPVTNLWVDETSSLIFSEDDLTVSWLNPTTNSYIINTALLNFDVSVYNGATLLRTETIAGVTAGLRQKYTYSYAKNLIDGGPRRTVTISVVARDAAGGVSSATAAIFTNPPPGIPIDIEVTPGIGSNKITFTPPRDLDYEGILIWSSAVNPFELNESTLIFEGSDTFFAHNGIATSTKQYYRFATYDGFGKDYTGSTLNVSSTYSSVPISTDFDKNKLRNSDFFGKQPGNRPTYWLAYNNAGIAVTYTTPTGFLSATAFGLRADASTSNTFGAMTSIADAPDGWGVVGGWKRNTTYIISFYARKVAGAGMTTMRLEWNSPPVSGTIDVTNPILNVEYQRYVFRISWGGTVEALGRLYIHAFGNKVAGDEIHISKVMVEEGDVVSEYKPRVEELVTLQAINVTGVLQDTQLAAISATKLTGTIDEARIAALAASKISGQLTNTQIATIDAAKIIGALRPDQMAAIDLALATGRITSTQITDGAISTPKLSAFAVQAGNIAAGAVTALKIAAGEINGDHIRGNTITGGHIVANSILTGNIAARQITAEKIEAGSITGNEIRAFAILAGNIAANAITTGKLLVTGQGKALNDDPSCVDATAWFQAGAGSFVVQLDTSVPIGTHSIRTTNPTMLQSRQFPVEANKTYKVSCYAKQVAGGGRLYVRMYCYNATNGLVNFHVTGLTPTTLMLEDMVVPFGWTRYTGSIRPNPGAVKATVLVHTNWDNVGVTDLTDIRAEEYIGADLIVDGSINAIKLVAGSITTNEIAAGAIRAGNIEAGAITTAKIQAGAVTASTIAASSITGDRLVFNTITGDRIATGAIDASKIVVGGLSGTIIQNGTITTAKIGAGQITANEISTGTITTDRLVVNAATVLSAGSVPMNIGMVHAGGTQRTSLTFNVITVTTTGTPITVDWAYEVNLTPVFANPFPSDYMFVGVVVFRNGVRIDQVRAGENSASTGADGGQLLFRAYLTTAADSRWRGTINGTFREVPLPGVHTYSFVANFDPYDGSAGDFGSGYPKTFTGGYSTAGGYMVVQENKV